MTAKGPESHARRGRSLGGPRGAVRKKDLPAMACGADAGRGMHSQPHLAAVGQARPAGMDADPNPDVDGAWPGSRADAPPDPQRRIDGARGSREVFRTWSGRLPAEPEQRAPGPPGRAPEGPGRTLRRRATVAARWRGAARGAGGGGGTEMGGPRYVASASYVLPSTARPPGRAEVGPSPLAVITWSGPSLQPPE
jgi:hypothetical protein